MCLHWPSYHQKPRCGRVKAKGKQRPGELTYKKRTSTLQPLWGFPGGSDSKESAFNAGNQGLIPWRRDWLPTPIFLPGEFHGQKPGGLHSQGSQRVRHDWSKWAHAVVRVLYMFWILIPFRKMTYKYFLPFCRLFLYVLHFCMPKTMYGF